MARTWFHASSLLKGGDQRSRAEGRWGQQEGLRTHQGHRLPLADTSDHPPRPWGMEQRLGVGLLPLFLDWSWLFRGRAVAHLSCSTQLHSGPGLSLLCGLMWVVCSLCCVLGC